MILTGGTGVFGGKNLFQCYFVSPHVPMLLCLPPNLTWVEAGPPPWEADDWTPETCHGLPTSDNVDQLYKPVKYIFIPNTMCHLPAHLKARHNKIIHVYVTWEKWVVGGQRLVSVSCIWLRRIITAIRDLRFSSWYYSPRSSRMLHRVVRRLWLTFRNNIEHTYLTLFYVLPTQCIYVFCVDLTTNSDYFPVQH